MSFASRIVLTSVLCFASSAMPAHITYTFSGTASGTLGGTTFANTLVQETAIGETANVVSLLTIARGNPISILEEPVSTVTITIAGIRSTTVTDPSAVIVSSDCSRDCQRLPLVVTRCWDTTWRLPSARCRQVRAAQAIRRVL